jgi:hypothetical protein
MVGTQAELILRSSQAAAQTLGLSLHVLNASGDGIAIATYASVGQRTLTIAPEKAPPGTAAVIVIRPRQGGAGFKYTIPMAALPKLGAMNKGLDPRGRYDAVRRLKVYFRSSPFRDPSCGIL